MYEKFFRFQSLRYTLLDQLQNEEDLFFRDSLSSPAVLKLSLTHRGKILHALEELWSSRVFLRPGR